MQGTSKSTAKGRHHYAFDAAFLLGTTIQRLNDTISLDHGVQCDALLDVEDSLVSIRRLLHIYFVQLIERERHALVDESNEEEYDDDMDKIPLSLEESVNVLGEVMEARAAHHQRCRRHSFPGDLDRLEEMGLARSSSMGSTTLLEQRAGDNSPSSGSKPFETSRSPTDSLLFRLIVSLQLCLVRINDAHALMGGKRIQTVGKISILSMTFPLTCLGSSWLVLRPHFKNNQLGAAEMVSKLSITSAGFSMLYRWGFRLWTFGKLSKSIIALEEWREQWIGVQEMSSSPLSSRDAKAKTERLIDIAKKQNSKTSFWQSEGELRFLVLKRAMDLLYASVGTALEVTKPASGTHRGPSWQTSLTAMAAASYLSLIGPNKRATEAVSKSSSELIQNAWGMVSQPAIKLLSLRATRLLKGAALAERITIEGVPCFILSKDSCADVIVALKRFERQEKRRAMVSRLSTIDEKTGGRHQRQRSSSSPFRERNVILHLTGGGFFAHTIASDLPYLLDWSQSAGAIVICPEYPLLPENTFPVALEQVTKVYTTLMKGNASSMLGFEVRRIVVTGESAGGNLAAAMCVKLGNRLSFANRFARNRNAVSASGEDGFESNSYSTVRLPDALMLSCPALNLSLEISPSRVIGDQDPVLPSGLISAISDAYVPAEVGVSKRDPLVSPLYAPDDILRLFPPTLLYASSDDPLLDDSVYFNTRLRCLGVLSDLRATHHMPHAYWGLGTAGFPEAQQVQLECQEFLREQLDS